MTRLIKLTNDQSDADLRSQVAAAEAMVVEQGAMRVLAHRKAIAKGQSR